MIFQIQISCNAYLADITKDSNLLTIRAGIFSVTYTFASVIGGVFAGFFSWVYFLMHLKFFINEYWSISLSEFINL